MGNESSKSRNSHNRKDETATSFTTTTVQKIQKAIPSAIKPNCAGTSSSSNIIQRHLEQATKTKTLMLKGMGIKVAPQIIDELAMDLRTMDLSSNRLRELPLSIGQFSVLRQLHIQDNRFTELPEELGCLRKLEVLNAAGNQLETIPESLIGCTALSNVNLANNRLSFVPISLTNMMRLELLDLSGNNITAIPNEISGLRATELNLQRNQLSTLNAFNLSKCARLKTLRVDENCLLKEEFVQDLLEHSQLSLITFEGNLFQEKDFQLLPGYEQYERRFTATKRRLF